MVGKRAMLGAGMVIAGAVAAWGQTLPSIPSMARGGGRGAATRTAPRAAAAATAAATQATAWVTRGQLDKLEFHSVMDPPAGAGARPLVFPDLQTGVVFDKAEYAQGEPVRTMLVVHSMLASLTRAVRARADLGPEHGAAVVEGSARFELVRKKEGGGEEIVGDLKAATAGVNRLTQKSMVLKPGDYWVNMGDARNVAAAGKRAAGGNLAAGDYTLRFWVEGQRAEGSFRVRAGAEPRAAGGAEQAADKGAADEVKQGMIFAMSGGWQTRKATPAAAKEELWPMESPYPSPRAWNDFEPALGLGIGEGATERYYARISEVPSGDDVVKIAAAFVGKGTSHLRVTLTPVNGGKAGGPARQIPRYPSVYLLVENLGQTARMRGFNDREYIQTGDSVMFTRPIVIDITLPEQGGPNSYFQGKARVSVAVASDPVWYGPSEDAEDNGGQVLGNGRVRAAPASRWTGIVKSAPMEVTLARPGEEAGGEGGDAKKDDE
jgi:hypothetical protein